MARPLRIEYPGAFYHVTSRGNERKDIFESNTEREIFLSYLASAQEKYEAVIHAYCLMSNHYHLMIETPLGNLSQIMKYINSSYSNFFNIKRKRTGHLLQGRYKAILVEADAYATELSRYIHLNPVRAGMVRSPEEYRWSSYSYYTERSSPSWLKTEFILGYFGTDPTQSRGGLNGVRPTHLTYLLNPWKIRFGLLFIRAVIKGAKTWPGLYVSNIEDLESDQHYSEIYP